MVPFEGGDDAPIVADRGLVLVVDPLVDRPRLGGGRDDPPFRSVALQQKVDQAHMRAPEATHHRRLALQRALAGVDTLERLEILLAGEDEMLVAGKDRIDAIDGSQIERSVFHLL